MKKASPLRKGFGMFRTFLLSSIVWISSVGQAGSQPLKQCESFIRRYETAHGIPHKLLSAISLVESGRKIQGTVVAHPWTINANGKPYVFTSKQEAIAMVRKLRQQGISSIDVGCMQVNLKQHPGAFPTLDAAFDPETNIAYAAKFLKAKKIDKGTWGKAVAHYHSATPEFHVPYKARVLKTWEKVQNGRFSYPTLLDQETSSLATFMANLDKHKGQFVKKIKTSNGRHVPLIVRFAPYRGFNGGIHKTNGVFKIAKNKEPAPVIFIDGKPQMVGKVIINKTSLASQNSLTGKVLRINTKPKQIVVKRKSKRPKLSKFRSR